MPQIKSNIRIQKNRATTQLNLHRNKPRSNKIFAFKTKPLSPKCSPTSWLTFSKQQASNRPTSTIASTALPQNKTAFYPKLKLHLSPLQKYPTIFQKNQNLFDNSTTKAI